MIAWNSSTLTVTLGDSTYSFSLVSSSRATSDGRLPRTSVSPRNGQGDFAVGANFDARRHRLLLEHADVDGVTGVDEVVVLARRRRGRGGQIVYPDVPTPCGRRPQQEAATR